jgi:hypothetical protein
MHRGDAYPASEQANGDGEGEAQLEAGDTIEGKQDEGRAADREGSGEHQHRGAPDEVGGTEEDLPHGLLLYSPRYG